MAANLSYKGIGALPGIPNNPNLNYRVHGLAGYEDYLRSGKIRSNPLGKYSHAYFSSGSPLDRYSARKAGSHIVVSGSKRIKQPTSASGFPTAKNLGKYNPFSVYTKGAGEGAYRLLYKNNPLVQVAKTAGRSALGIGGAVLGDMVIPDVANAGSGLGVMQRFPNQRQERKPYMDYLARSK